MGCFSQAGKTMILPKYIGNSTIDELSRLSVRQRTFTATSHSRCLRILLGSVLWSESSGDLKRMLRLDQYRAGTIYTNTSSVLILSHGRISAHETSSSLFKSPHLPKRVIFHTPPLLPIRGQPCIAYDYCIAPLELLVLVHGMCCYHCQ